MICASALHGPKSASLSLTYLPLVIIQSIGSLDVLDKQLNTYAMRVKEWYGWHFPELAKILNDNLAYSRVVLKMGFRSNAREADLSVS